MLKIYLDYYGESVFTFPLDMGPEPEGTTVVDREGLSSLAGSAGEATPPAGMEGNTSGEKPAYHLPSLGKWHTFFFF